MSNSAAQTKADERRARNLASANASRQRRREQISALTQEKARLTEANALLRSRLHISDAASLPALHSLPPVSNSSHRGRPGTVELGPAMQQVVRRKEMDGRALVDLLDRAVSGSNVKTPPIDPEAAALLEEASQKIPRDVKRPLKFVAERPTSKSKSSKSKGSSNSKAR